MNRRKVLLLVAAVIAALGTALVFLYVHSADNRADRRYGAVTVLKAVKQIDPGETVAAAEAAGKIQSATVSQQDVLTGAINGLEPITGKTATATIYPGEQITTDKFGTAAVAATGLSIPKGKIAISISLSDPARVAGFVSPGDNVAVFMSGSQAGTPFTRLMLPNVEVIAAGATTVTPTTTTTANGTQSTEQLPKTLLTLAVTQSEAERLIFASGNGTLAFGLLNPSSQVAASAGVTQANLFR